MNKTYVLVLAEERKIKKLISRFSKLEETHLFFRYKALKEMIEEAVMDVGNEEPPPGAEENAEAAG